MEQMILKAVTTATDKGTFTAVISTASIDRVKDVVEPQAMANALAKWANLGKLVPLAWDHTKEVIGHIDPATVAIRGPEVTADGFIDQSIDRGAEAWRLIKSGTVSFSFGYLFDPKTGGTKRPGGGYRIKELDVFEISVVPIAPANNDTRVLRWKGMATGASLQLLESMIAQAQEYIDKAPDPEDGKEMQSILDDLKELVADKDDAADQAEDQDGKALRRRAGAAALDFATGGKRLPDPEPEPDPEPAPEPEPAPDPPDAATLRAKASKLSAQLKREENAKRIPELPPEPEPEPDPEPAPEPADAATLRAKASKLTSELEREENAKRLPEIPDQKPEHAVLHITHEEMAGLAEGQLKAVWSAAYVNTLPDSAFLYIEPGGDRDADGKTTPRSLRHFPYKDSSGAVDLPHLRNALARIPQSNLPPSVKDQLTAKAQRILDGQKSVTAPVDVTDQEARGPRSADPLRARARAVALEFASDGESRRKPPRKQVQKPEPELELTDLKRHMYETTLKVLSGVEEP